MRALRRWWSALRHGGAGRLRDYETRILETLCAALPKADSEVLARQLANLGVVRRLDEDRVVRLRFFDARSVPRLANQGRAQVIARLIVESVGKRIYVIALADRGLLAALEFAKAPGALAAGGCFRVTSVKTFDG